MAQNKYNSEVTMSVMGKSCEGQVVFFFFIEAHVSGLFNLEMPPKHPHPTKQKGPHPVSSAVLGSP